MRGRINVIAAYTVTVLVVLQLLSESPVSRIKSKNKQLNASEKKLFSNIDVTCASFSSSPNNLWKKLHGDILQASYWPLRHVNNTNFTSWVDQIFEHHFQSWQIGRSLGQRPDPRETSRILEVLSNRIAFLNKKSKRADAISPPLHILVTGGSVTAGNNCETNPVGLPAVDWRKIVTDCPWPTRLENLFNRVLFAGQTVVKVTNLAAGGSSTEIGKVVLEYQLFPEKVKQEMPHIVVWSHAANDLQEHDHDAIYYQALTGYVAAARNLWPCDDYLPLVIMFEDSSGTDYYEAANDVTGMIGKMTSWYGLMSASHANVVKHKIWANYNNSSYIESIMGTGWNLHYGLGFHISAAWVLFFNFLSIFVEYCDERHSLQVEQENSAFILPKKYLPPYKKGGDHVSLLNEWQDNLNKSKAYCSEHFDGETICTYSWMVNQMTDVRTAGHVSEMLRGVLKSSTGWKASGFPVKQPRAGWYAEVENAEFTLEIPVTMDTKFMTIMSMKSYGENFLNTKLRVRVEILRNSSNSGDKPREQTNDNPTAQYTIDGYHETKTSIHVTNKFQLPGGGARDGDMIIVRADLINGAYFKINGFAFCVS